MDIAEWREALFSPIDLSAFCNEFGFKKKTVRSWLYEGATPENENWERMNFCVAEYKRKTKAPQPFRQQDWYIIIDKSGGLDKFSKKIGEPKSKILPYLTLQKRAYYKGVARKIRSQVFFEHKILGGYNDTKAL